MTDQFTAEIQRRGREVPVRLAELYDTQMLWKYYCFLQDENVAGGFFSKADADRIFERHVYESLLFSLAACEEYYVATGRPVSRETSVLDAGSGPGLPGFLLAAREDAPRVTFLDSSQRRLKRLADYAMSEYPEDHERRFKFQYRRAEEYTGRYDLIVSRALIPFPAVVELLGHLQQPGGIMILWSPRDFIPDDRLTTYLDQLGYVSRETVPIPELSFLGRREINVLKKARSSQKGYPRKWKQIKDSIPEWNPVRKPDS